MQQNSLLGTSCIIRHDISSFISHYSLGIKTLRLYVSQKPKYYYNGRITLLLAPLPLLSDRFLLQFFEGLFNVVLQFLLFNILKGGFYREDSSSIIEFFRSLT